MDIEDKNYMIELIILMMQHFLQGGLLNTLFGILYKLKLFTFGTLLKFNCQENDLLTYPVYLKINMLSLLFLRILKIRNHLLSVISTIRIFLVLNLTITHYGN